MDDATLEAYTLALKDLDLRAFQVAMAILSEARRREGETAFPELGYVLDVMDDAREKYITANKPELNTMPVMEPAAALARIDSRTGKRGISNDR